jgi:hypothetical protein
MAVPGGPNSITFEGQNRGGIAFNRSKKKLKINAFDPSNPLT